MAGYKGAKHLDTADEAKIIRLAAEGMPNNQIAKVIGVSVPTIQKCFHKNVAQIGKMKKDILDKAMAGQAKATANQMVEVCQNLRKVVLECSRLMTSDKIDKGSAPQIATTLGICVDKLQLLIGEPTDRVNVRFTDKQAMLDYIKQPVDSDSVTVTAPPKPVIPDKA